jgi:MFS-type transporter involved in bile tolerance (Atg22 family)
MKGAQTKLSRNNLQNYIFAFYCLGFLLAIMTCWLTEYFEPPFSYRQVIIESLAMILLGCITVYLNWRLIQRIKYLEEILVICTSCKSAQIDEGWVSIPGCCIKKAQILE